MLKNKNKNSKKEERFDLSEFLNKVLRQYIISRKTNLNQIVINFKDFDLNEFGYVNREQFMRILRAMDLEKLASRQKFLEKTDPYDNNVITFSKLVHTLKKLRVKQGQKTISAVEWIALNA